MSEMKRLRLLICPILLGLALPAVPASAQGLPTRVGIDLLYLKDTDPVVARSVRHWAESVDQRLEQSLRFDDSLRMPRQGLVTAQAIERSSPLTRQEMELYWRNTGAIQVAFGRGTRTGGTTRLTALVYLGDLKGSLVSPVIPVSHSITPGNALEATNMILAIAFYALGVDAQSRPGTACLLLARSNRYAGALSNSIQSAADVKRAIATRLQAHACGGRAR